MYLVYKRVTAEYETYTLYRVEPKFETGGQINWEKDWNTGCSLVKKDSIKHNYLGHQGQVDHWFCHIDGGTDVASPPYNTHSSIGQKNLAKCHASYSLF